MKLRNLSQSPLNTTYLGVLRGVFDFYGIAISDSVLFGASGHGFAINVHPELCPSGPYCWNKEPVRRLLRNLGVQMEVIGFYSSERALEERHHVEGIVRMHIDSGHPCALLNLENQLILGYDEEAFEVAQPWPGVNFPPKSLTFGTWQELGEEIHIDFYSFTPTHPKALRTAVEESLCYAAAAWRGFGPRAYEKWHVAIQSGFGATHGNWWNGTVWSECRRHLVGYFQEVAGQLAEPNLGESLSSLYGVVADSLAAVAEKDRPAEDQIKKLLVAKAAEEEAISLIEGHLNRFRSSTAPIV